MNHGADQTISMFAAVTFALMTVFQPRRSLVTRTAPGESLQRNYALTGTGAQEITLATTN